MMRPILVVLLFIGLCVCTAGPPVTSLASGPNGTLRFQTLTIPIPGDAFLAGEETGAPATAFGVLRLPEGSAGRVPAVVVAHGYSGWTGADQGWATLLPQWGIATFRLDSFSDRGINEVCTSRQRITLGSRLTDAYRALELLRTHPRIDPERMAILGLSHGGLVAVTTSFVRFQPMLSPQGHHFAAHLAFYSAGCWVTFIDDDKLVPVPVRLFRGTADDWTPLGSCSAYVQRVRTAGNDIALFEYLDGYHGFDNPQIPERLWRPNVLNARRCHWVEETPGKLVHRETRQPLSRDDPCILLGGTVGYNEQAHQRAQKDVRTFLTEVFGLSQVEKR
jgi:dienelactone hydrolase